MKPVSARLDVTVAFYDLDPMGIVWHGNYARYFELARCAVLEKISFSYNDMKASGYSWPVVDLQIRYIRPARLSQKLTCEATIVEFENRLKIKYEIFCADTGGRLTKGFTVQVAVDNKNQELLLVTPPILHEKMRLAYANSD